ncbi:MAG: 30S ribosomal protein S16 [Bacteroidetes bacterium HGW-Bacteroidetes-21]|jgi:small subunit ribosomal protein S16|nr:MAG: 30S ribosomal protein S16 [Bacteroidetes bacterium HGW-Bacteroidetes-21]
MAVKIRLSRHGKKKNPFYHIVVADGRAPRDGKFIEKIGTYNPITNPATIVLDFEKALDWMNKGAVPTATARAILSYEGVMMKKHLLEGVKKGAFDEASAESRFKLWKDEQYARISNKKSKLASNLDKSLKEQLEAEAKVNDARANAIAKKRAAQLEKENQTEEVANEEEVVAEAPVAEAVATEEVVAEEAPVAETPAVEVSEAPEAAAESTPETQE